MATHLGQPSGFLPIGHHDAMINWWGNHNLFGLWLTPVLIAVVYYFVPRITNTPLYSHTLSLISFWGLVFVYAAVGDHHLLQSPTPGLAEDHRRREQRRPSSSPYSRSSPTSSSPCEGSGAASSRACRCASY